MWQTMSVIVSFRTLSNAEPNSSSKPIGERKVEVMDRIRHLPLPITSVANCGQDFLELSVASEGDMNFVYSELARVLADIQDIILASRLIGRCIDAG